ncbi:pterin-4a-carbinolamine dehydratase, putative [Perkinsus marinus ATCC 50983]|uniref:4a-hydroxytetrahydrobiopterin dehydratase n=1 Tax=Perkinsus marinus (strain ATCC 50983 / TXsc) TaxID=423536 RepID=C5M1J2_PERM5|nr:pterin-4a-carbinolamine dehydratase, putative [Perkinsus marinus ATCC 50983]EEQ97150.1 pterin-4a-carbinolamine dehydratase, putative [Perkinsus marinus ATCC 50983]|eukprot:XP_002764433.1 pterin-4a-carbinolamine dehydratase, putative [Perkinsus marinus ATCC 50983]
MPGAVKLSTQQVATMIASRTPKWTQSSVASQGERGFEESVPDRFTVGAAEKISRNFQFRNFNEAFGFMTRVALYAEKADHHPNWYNVYNKVDVELSTHDAGGVTEKDFSLAEKMDKIAATMAS